MHLRGLLIGFCALFASVAHAQAPAAGSKGGPGLALFTAKALVCSWEGEQFVDHALILVKDGRIESVTPRADASVPAGYVVRDLGPLWCMPGMIDLHSHVGGAMDINDMVYVTNPELRVSTSVVTDNGNLRRAIAGAVTSVLFIPGSGTNSGGQGILIKTGLPKYEESVIRDPGSLKVAQWGNPERWAFGVGKSFENYHIRQMFTQGRGYWKAWKDFEAGQGPKPEKNIRFELLRSLFDHKTQVSVHTQVAQVVMMTIVMIRGEFGLDVYIDHGEFGGYKYAALAQKMGVPAILGPRNVDTPSRSMIDWVGSNPERMQGLAAGYADAGHTQIGFNTDAPVIPQEELFLQSAMNVRLGFDNSGMAAVRGHTIVPAKTAAIDHRTGSLEKGKDADIVVISGDPSDPRSSVELVFIDGRVVYDPKIEPRRF